MVVTLVIGDSDGTVTFVSLAVSLGLVCSVTFKSNSLVVGSCSSVVAMFVLSVTGDSDDVIWSGLVIVSDFVFAVVAMSVTPVVVTITWAIVVSAMTDASTV